MDVLTYALCKKAINKIDSIITTDETTIEGNPINFTTKSAQNAKSTIISIEPIQDLSHGVPSPDNSCPISGRSYIRILGTNGKESTDHDYKVSTDLSISFGGQLVYGGTFDIENGVLVIDRKIEVFDGSNDEEWEFEQLNTASYMRYQVGIIAKTMHAPITNLFEGVMPCSYTSLDNGQLAFVESGNTDYFNVRYDNILSLEDWKTYLASNPLQVVYELAAPVTIQRISNKISLLEGVNNISTDGDKITLTYRTGKVATLDDLKEQIAESQILTDTITGDNYILVVTNGVLRVQKIGDDEEG